MMQDIVETWIQRILAPLGWPVSQTPGDASQPTWITWNLVQGREYMAGNDATRLTHMFQLHAYTHGENSEHREAFFAAVTALKAAGAKVYSWGADEYEKDTGVCHIACTCTWRQKHGDV